ncbi:MAG: hypothetical protein Q4F72_11445 [Desulfovibrionaceae bacterium]|nr:hypothetical protein [Desulfovibrionaceae bacterium]
MSKFTNLIDFLADYHDQVMGCEKKALAALDGGDADAYRALMKEKAEKMARIAEEAAPYLEQEPEYIRSEAGHSLKAFAASAKMGLRLQSPFYWSALLWDEDAKPGDPDTLQVFISELSSEISGKE